MSVTPLALQRPYIDEEAHVNLQGYIDTQDRGSPPIFVGREEIIDRLSKDVARCRSSEDPKECFTLVIHGAPGAGKTSLLAEIRNLFDDQKEGPGGWNSPIVVVELSGEMLSSEVGFAKEIIDARRGEHSNARQATTPTVSGLARLFGLETGRHSAVTDRTIEQQIQSPSEVWRAIVDNTSVEEKETVFLLLIDEAQVISANGEKSDKNDIAMALHGGSQYTQGLKMLPVFAGLSDLESVLAHRGISRLGTDASIKLGSLGQNETEFLVSSWMQFEPFGFENLFTSADTRRVSKILAIASEGWPRHANAYLKELARSIIEEGSSTNLTINLDQVLDRGHDSKIKYYQSRVNAADISDYASVICDLTRQSTDGSVRSDTLYEIAKDKYEISRSESRRYQQSAVHAGIFEDASDLDPTRFQFPIPSFFTYMQCRRDPVAFKKLMNAQISMQVEG